MLLAEHLTFRFALGASLMQASIVCMVGGIFDELRFGILYTEGARVHGHTTTAMRDISTPRPRGEDVGSTQNIGGVSIWSRNCCAPSRKGCAVNGRITKASDKGVHTHTLPLPATPLAPPAPLLLICPSAHPFVYLSCLSVTLNFSDH